MFNQSLRFKNSDAGEQNTEKLLNRSAPLNPPDIKAESTNLPIDVTPPTIGEIITATKQINSGKATGLESVPTEVLKSHVKLLRHRSSLYKQLNGTRHYTLTSMIKDFYGKHGIQLTDCMQLDDLDFSDNLALPSHTHQQMQVKTTSVAEASASVGPNIHEGKDNILRHDTENTNPITLDGEALEGAESFTYLGCIINKQ
ncbi:unnamed protein product [Schistosoma margrebowiei]|uniref:Uncharacterized protein n=1 Tax=Schistosoma margrebowiei TaxID=48269 RepID=A0A183LC10_9TREM|nr:unnamed protein product [Schistosoma margrebowiei]